MGIDMNEYKKRLKPFLDDINKIKSDNVAILIRHSIRESHILGKIISQYLLTEEGKELAFWFGKNLPKDRKIRIFYSPVERCKQTAIFIKKGLQLNKNIKIESIEKKEYLDTIVNNKEFDKLVKKYTCSKFVNKWINKEISNKIIKNPNISFYQMMNEIILSMKKQKEKSLDIYIAHDFNIFLIREFIFKNRNKNIEWPDYLDGIIISSENDNKIKLKWRKFEKIINLKKFI